MNKLFFLGFLIFIFSCKPKNEIKEESTSSVQKTEEDVQTNTNTQNTSSSELKIHEVNGDLKWLEIQSAMNHANPEGKMFFVDVYTDWCGWCKVMDKKTFSDPKVQKALNERFHVVKFNAEQKNSIIYKNTQFDWQNMGRNGINMLAVQWLGGEMGFPSYVYLDKDKNPIKKTAGFMPAEDFLKELNTVK